VPEGAARKAGEGAAAPPSPTSRHAAGPPLPEGVVRANTIVRRKTSTPVGE